MWGNGVTEDGFVVAADPEDMKNACRMGKEAQGAAMGHSALQSVCSPEANAIAIDCAWFVGKPVRLLASKINFPVRTGTFVRQMRLSRLVS